MLHNTLQALAAALRQPAAQLEAQARHWVQQLVLVAQAGLLLRHAPQAVAQAFVRSRLGSSSCGWVVGAAMCRAVMSTPFCSAHCRNEKNVAAAQVHV